MNALKIVNLPKSLNSLKCVNSVKNVNLLKKLDSLKSVNSLNYLNSQNFCLNINFGQNWTKQFGRTLRNVKPSKIDFVSRMGTEWPLTIADSAVPGRFTASSSSCRICGNMISISRSALGGESLPWQAFFISLLRSP